MPHVCTQKLLLLLGFVTFADANICNGVQSFTAEDWKAAASFSSDGAVQLSTKQISWSDWSRLWVPLGQRSMFELEAQLRDCPDGAVSAILHALPALEQEAGDATTLEIVKMLYHLVADRPYFALETTPSPWQQNWLLAVASFVRFVYFKWVNIRQGEKSETSEPDTFSVANPALKSYHTFLFKNTLGEFLKSGVYDLPITENSVVFSESFAFMSFCRMHEVTLILESGVYKGMSTEVWSHFAEDVVAVDVFLTPEAKERLRSRQNVQLLEGDGRQLLPGVLEKFPGRNTAIFIDGPKGELAIRLAMALREHPAVKFVAIHDMGPYREHLRELGAFFFSDELWYQEAYKHLDAPYRERPDLEAGGTMAFLPGSVAASS